MPPSRENIGLLLGFLGVVIFSGTLPGTRIALDALDPYFVTAARASIAGVGALALLVLMRRPLPPRHLWGQIAIATLGVTVGFPLLTAIATVSVPVAHGAVVTGILPLATAVTAALLGHERPDRGFWLAAFIGTVLVVTYALTHGGAGTLAAGDLLLLGAVASAAIGYTASGRLTLSMPGWEVISWAVVMSLPLALIALVVLAPADFAAVPARVWIGVGYLGLMSQWLGFFAWNAGLAIAGIARVSQVQLTQPFVTIAFAALINRETIDLTTLAFACAVVATVLAGQRMRVTRN